MQAEGYCQCGCGGLAPIAKKTRRGYIKGEPMRFIQGHHLRLAEYKAGLYTPERNAKIAAAHADGRIPSPERLSGPEHPSWRGDEISYVHAHARVVQAKGKPEQYRCEQCGAQAAEWALNHSHPDLQHGERFGLTLAYSANPDAYHPLCRSCHRRADSRGGYSCPILS